MRRPLALTALTALLAVAVAAAARAEDPRLLSARIAVNLFAKTCLAHLGEPAKAVHAAGEDLAMGELPPDMARPFLVGLPGRAFSAGMDAAGFVVAIPDGGLCMVYAQLADPAEVGTRFTSVMEDFSGDAFEMRLTGQTETDGRISRAWDLAPTAGQLKKLRARFGTRDFPALFEVGLTTAPPGGLFEAVLSTASKVVPKG